MKKKFTVEGMMCSACQVHVEKAVSKVEGTKNVNVNLLTKTMEVDIENENIVQKINEAVDKAGYHSFLKEESIEKNEFYNAQSIETKKLVVRLSLSLALLVSLFYLSMGYMMGWCLGALSNEPIIIAIVEMVLSFSIICINNRFFVSGLKSTIHGAPNMDTLVALGSGTAFIYSFVLMIIMLFNINDPDKVMSVSMNLSFETAGMIPALITIGKTLEGLSKSKTTNALKDLVDLIPKTACVIRENKEIIVSIDELTEGEIFVVRPGEAFPADGVIIDGQTSVDESALTGEFMPRDKQTGDVVYAASINKNGTTICKATKTGENTSFSKVIKLVEEASSSKAPISRIADRVSGVFVPIVIALSVFVFVVWLIIGLNTALTVVETPMAYAISRAVSVLVISCPCALGLATPVAIMVSSGKGAKESVLFKTAESIERAGKSRIVVFDKTGTITTGRPTVTDIKTLIDEKEFLLMVGSLESKSSHPLAKAVCVYIENKLNDTCYKQVDGFVEIPGKGVKGLIENREIYGLNTNSAKEIVELKKEWSDFIDELSEKGKTPMIFIFDKKLIGIIGVFDEIKQDSKEAIKEFKKSGIIPVMLTGDNKKTAKTIAEETGIEHFLAEVLSEEKGIAIQKLKEQGFVMMVGDGINDALALTIADTGVAIGAGTEVAIDSADVVLVKSSLMDAVKALRLSRQTIKIIKQNLFWAFIYNVIMIPIAAGAFYATNIDWLKELKPWYGAAAMSLSSVIVVLNALRLNLFSNTKNINKKKAISFSEESLQLEKNNIGENIKMKKTFIVEGMMCVHCKKRVEDAALSVNGVESAEADLENKTLVVECKKEAEENQIKKAITEAGYEAK